MKILVVGDKCNDIYRYGIVTRISPEAPVPIFQPHHFNKTDGMAGNVLNNITALGGRVTLCGNKRLPEKTRFVDKVSNQMLLRVDENDKIDRVENLQYYLDMEKWDAIVISDYNKGFLTSEDIFKISLYGDKNNILTFLDSKKQFKGNWFHHVDFIKINEKEYLENEGNFDGYKNQLIVTLGDRGARHFDKHLKGSFLYELEDKAEVRDLSGAGDTFLAAFVVNYLNTHDIASAIRFANKCASYVVTQKGVVVVDPSKID